MPDMPDRRRALRADCERCFGLCCVVPAFARSADFAFDKAAGEPCRHLGGFACTVLYGYLVRETDDYNAPLLLLAWLVFVSAVLWDAVAAWRARPVSTGNGTGSVSV